MVNAKVAAFPDVTVFEDKYDFIWSRDFAFMNSFDISYIRAEFIKPCQNLLTKDGILILGWHSDFSGKMKGNWAHFCNCSISCGNLIVVRKT